ncbi:MAG: thioredoxin-disulfide reductase [Chloroflexi bacterium]|nr:thioredoxin-disulfide reductase [Chloroflexota bacterium]
MDLNLHDVQTSKDLIDSPLEGNVEELVIIGAGPAGMAAALYAARSDLSPLVITGTQLGGQVAISHLIENYPGFIDGIGGAELSDLLQKHAEKFGARFEFDQVDSVDLSGQPYKIKIYSREILAKSLILATGASPVFLGIPGEKKLAGRGVSYCATCDGFFFRGKDVIVVGGGDSALEEAIFLTRFASSVTIVHRRDELRACLLLQQRAKENAKISFRLNTIVTEVIGENAVEAVRLKDVISGGEQVVPTQGVFIFIGHRPNTELFTGQLDMDEQGYLVTDVSMKTKAPGVFAAGEVADPDYRQVITSAGMGAASAIQAVRYLESIQG